VETVIGGEEDDYVSTPVKNGNCLKIEDTSWDTLCVPECDGKICGPDYCGGYCGDCGDKQCAGDQKSCIDYNCEEISVVQLNAHAQYTSLYSGSYTPGTGSDLEDQIRFNLDLFQTPGSFDLTSENNSNFATCAQCVMIYEDINPADGKEAKMYFQQQGKMVIEQMDTDEHGKLSGKSSGNITGVRVEEVVLDQNMVSIPIPGGSCIEITDGEWDTGVCKPHCEEGAICTADGCGGICGCTNNQYCNEEGTECLDYQCEKITLDKISAPDYSKASYISNYSPASGDPAVPDLFTMMFAGGVEKGTYDLGKENNTSLSTCSQCLVLQEDRDEANQTIGKYFFQQKGYVYIGELGTNMDGKASGESIGSLSGVRLIEVDLDTSSFETTPIKGGDCFEIESAEWHTLCVPNCEGKICGSDGCGGSCGDPCSEDDKTCNEEGTGCIDHQCKKLSLGEIKEDTLAKRQNTMFAKFTPSLGDSELDERLRIEFYSKQNPGSYNLGKGRNLNYRTCDQCVLVYEDIDGNQVKKAYFQTKGTMKIDKIISDNGGNIEGETKGSLENVRLYQVWIREDMTTTFLEGGDCLEIDSAEWSTTFE